MTMRSLLALRGFRAQHFAVFDRIPGPQAPLSTLQLTLTDFTA
jgi:hypothetical protein